MERSIEVIQITKSIAQSIRRNLENRLIEYYGENWLDAVNQRRASEGRRAVDGLSDERVCIAIFAYYPATEGWASWKLRHIMARQLLGIALKAYHGDTLTRADLERAREIRQGFRDAKRRPAPRPAPTPKPKMVRDDSGEHTIPVEYRRGDDVGQPVFLTAEEARLGVVKQIQINYPESVPDRTVQVRFPAGLSDFQELRIRGYGMPGDDDGDPGDARFTVYVESD